MNDEQIEAFQTALGGISTYLFNPTCRHRFFRSKQVTDS
jgi:hypothetical protein